MTEDRAGDAAPETFDELARAPGRGAHHGHRPRRDARSCSTSCASQPARPGSRVERAPPARAELGGLPPPVRTLGRAARSSRRLARLSAVSRASISSVLNTLQRDGLIERRRESSDRRVVTVVLTDRGRTVVADAFGEHNRREQALAGGGSRPPSSRTSPDCSIACSTPGPPAPRFEIEISNDLEIARDRSSSLSFSVGSPPDPPPGSHQAVSARTGKEYVDGLRDDRSVWLGGRAVTDVTGHPAFAGALRSLAEIFDLQHAEPDTCLAPHPETGELVNLSHLSPAHRRPRPPPSGVAPDAEHSVGLLGRSPDYLNVTFAGFAGRADVWAARQRRGRGQPRSRSRTSSRAPRPSRSRTPSSIPPSTRPRRPRRGRRRDRAAQGRRHRARHRGAAAPASSRRSPRSPTSSRCIPGSRYRRAREAKHALAFSIPMATPGLEVLCRDSFSIPAPLRPPFSTASTNRTRSSSSTTSRFHVERVFLDGDARSTTGHGHGWAANVMQQTSIRAHVKLSSRTSSRPAWPRR